MSIKFTEGQLRVYEDIMQQIPNVQKGGGKRKSTFMYKLEDCECCYCAYCVKNRCLLSECMLSEVIDCIELCC